MKKLEGGVYVTAKEYAEAVGLSPSTVRRRCDSGEMHLPHFRMGDRLWLIRVGRDNQEAKLVLNRIKSNIMELERDGVG